MTEASPPASAPAPAPAAPDATGFSLTNLLRELVDELSRSLHERGRLLTLEIQQTGQALAQIVLLAVAAALLVCAAWLTLMVGLYMACTAMGLHWSVALAVVALANGCGAAGLWWRVRRLLPKLGFAATLRTLGGRPGRERTDAAATRPAPAPRAGQPMPSGAGDA